MATTQSTRKYKKIQVVIGARFGRWIIIQETPYKPCEERRVLVRCDCGTERTVFYKSLRYGESKSCGCLLREVNASRLMRHGSSRARVYRIWQHMKDRCYNPKNEHYDCYGGRGITVCPEWLDFPTFQGWALSNGYEDRLTLDRINVDGNYEPSNCQWATRKGQSRNRRDNTLITAFGETKCGAEWAEDERCVVSRSTLYHRIIDGIRPEDAITMLDPYGRRR